MIMPCFLIICHCHLRCYSGVALLESPWCFFYTCQQRRWKLALSVRHEPDAPGRHLHREETPSCRSLLCRHAIWHMSSAKTDSDEPRSIKHGPMIFLIKSTQCFDQSLPQSFMKCWFTSMRHTTVCRGRPWMNACPRWTMSCEYCSIV